MGKGSLVSIEGRFTSSTYQNNDNQTVTRYEVTADRVESLESRAQTESRKQTGDFKTPSATATQEMKFEKPAAKPAAETKDVP